MVDGRAPLAVRSYNDFTYRDDVTTPFAPTADEDPALYLGFDQPFPARPMAVYLRIEPPRPEQVAADELAQFDPANHAVSCGSTTRRTGGGPSAPSTRRRR